MGGEGGGRGTLLLVLLYQLRCAMHTFLSSFDFSASERCGFFLNSDDRLMQVTTLISNMYKCTCTHHYAVPIIIAGSDSRWVGVRECER